MEELMRTTRYTRVGVGLVAAVTLAATTFTGTASAHDGASSNDGAIDNAKITHEHDQHGGTGGHLPAGHANVDLVSKLRLKNVEPDKIADVGVFNGYAYLAAWGGTTCKYNGIHVVDIHNLAAPTEVAFIQAKEGSFPGEGVQALHVTTPFFNGDLLVTNNEICKDKAGFGGMNIYDVTNPAHPTPLAEGVGDETVTGQGKKAANEIHSVFAWDAGDKAYAVIVDDEEGLDVDIMDITDPKNIAYLGDTDFTNPDREALESGFVAPPEGNGHEAEFTLDNAYVIGADEDFGPVAIDGRNLTDGTAIHARQGSNTRQLAPGQVVEGGSVFVGRACIGDAAVPAGDPNAVDIAVVERGVCTFTDKVANVIAAGGYDAVLVFNRVGSDACNQTSGMTVEGDIPTFGVAARQQGFAIFGVENQYNDAACLAAPAGSVLAPIAVGAHGDRLRFTAYFDGWGYVHLFRNSNGKMAELDTYAIPEGHDPAFISGFGDLSVHEVATSQSRADLAYFSYYAGGFRVAKIVNNTLVEVGHYIDVGGNNFWGVQVFTGPDGKEYVAASDRDFGLYIFRYTGSA